MSEDFPPPPTSGAADDAPDDFDRLLVRYFAGRAGREDRRRLDRWLAEGPDRARELDRLRYLWLRSAEEPMGVAVEGALARFKERVHQDARAMATTMAERPFRLAASRRRGWSWLVAAAGLMLAMGLGFWWRQVLVPTRTATLAAPPQLYATTRGQRTIVHLADGTQVTLAPSSTLEVPANFGIGTRDVQLTGLAFFAVAKDSSRPFRVHGGGGIAQVLGTKFSTRAGQGGEGTIEVVVAEGRVALRPTGMLDTVVPSGQVLTRGDFGYITADGQVAIVHGVDLTSRLGWVEGRLTFDRTPLPVVLRELETWYGVDFVIASPALRRAQLTTTFDNDALPDMIHLLEIALGAKAEVMGKTVTLRAVGRTR